jgi:hypothetical protein
MNLLLVSVLVICMIYTAAGCPFYQNVPTNVSATTNYTKLCDAIQAAEDNGAVVCVCDGAYVDVNETVCNISRGVTVSGCTVTGTIFPYLTLENNQTTAFYINVSNGEPVVFEYINIVFGVPFYGTAFTVVAQSQLTLSNMRCWFGFACVQVMSQTVGLTPPGVVADTVGFISNDYAILHFTGFVTCTHCTFVNSLIGSLVTRNVFPPASNNPWTAFFTLYDVHFMNVLYPMSIQLTLGGVMNPPTLSDNWVDAQNYYTCQTYMTLNNTFGSPGQPLCPTCSPCSTTVVQIALSIAVWAFIYVCVMWLIAKLCGGSKKKKKSGGDN